MHDKNTRVQEIRKPETVADRDRRARVAWLCRQVNTHAAGRQAAAREVLGCGCPRCVEALRLFGTDEGDGKAYGCRR